MKKNIVILYDQSGKEKLYLQNEKLAPVNSAKNQV